MQKSTEWGVRAIDAKTLSVQLEQPLPYFLELLSMPCFYPFRMVAKCVELVPEFVPAPDFLQGVRTVTKVEVLKI